MSRNGKSPTPLKFSRVFSRVRPPVHPLPYSFAIKISAVKITPTLPIPFGLASVALLAGVAWTLVARPADDAGSTLALGQTPLVVASPQGAIIRDAALQELMEAHRQQGGASVLPMPSGFLRNATFESAPQALPAGAR